MNKDIFKKVVFYAIVVSILFLIVLTILVRVHPILGFDIELSSKLQAEGDTPFKKFLITNFLSNVSYLGNTAIAFGMVIFTAAIFWLYEYHWESLFTLFAPVSALINSGVKLLIHRPRPGEQLVSVLDHQLSPSYPSGHVVFFTVFFGYLIAVMLIQKRIFSGLRIFIILLSILLIILVGVSRIYLGAHWVTDVIAGYFLGVILLAILVYFYARKYFSSSLHKK